MPVAFIVEHMEPYLFEWCLHEYCAMKDYLQHSPCALLITNASLILDYKGEGAADNAKYLSALQAHFSTNPQKYRLVPESIAEIYGSFGKVCMLDMRAQQQLSRQDEWDAVIFGGILGDHPPRDRPAPVRKHFNQIRHIGALQLATDTAVLVSRLILHNKLKLNEIPMVDEPTIKGKNRKGEASTVQMEGFSYVSKSLQLETGLLREGLSKKDKKNVHMSEGVRALLLGEDLEQEQLM